MSLSQSRWKQEHDRQKPKEGTTPNQPTIRTTAASSTDKYIPPHLKPKPKKNPAASQSTRNPSGNIFIADGDRTVSKKFTKSGHELNPQEDTKLRGFVNSSKHANLSTSHPDPMSLVPSPSRGIYTSPKKEDQIIGKEDQKLKNEESFHQEQDLTNLDFQLTFLRWIVKRTEEYKDAYPNRTDLFLYLCLKDAQDNRDLKVQIDRVSSLVREIRKLREGIFASGRRDSFAIVVYELSAELALESLDFAQLNTLLNHLILDLYGKVSISEHLVGSESTSSRHEQEEEHVANLINHHRRTIEEVLNRRLMFARVFLLLPIVTRLDLSRFIENLAQLGDILSDPSLPNPEPSNQPSTHNQVVLDISSTSHHHHHHHHHHPKLLELTRFFKLVLRKNYVQLNRQFIQPKLQKIVHSHLGNDPVITQWDDLLFLVFLNLMRPNLIWNVIQKSYYHLSPEDDAFIFNSLSLQFRSLDLFRRGSNNLQDSTVHQAVNSWLHSLNIQRNAKGIIQLK
ncbi:hypothetical protein PCANC_15032 [Puccinia coronata f. sp. avenae]|uniref:Uncharacterized protein n=1 Tax=Puccinia coronata f. sp. avenae TaxID=200324 RepID=A0A2N5U808_9BASI|nr:hypothetical protein PCANC_15032 [Puccinia coronata f. sp. avenae]